MAHSPDRAARLGDRALEDSEPSCLWLDRGDRPEPAPPLAARDEADLVIVGGGFTGLWAAVQAKEADPDRSVLLVEKESIGFGASGRNGGFCDASVTHGIANGLAHFPAEIGQLLSIGRDNYGDLLASLASHGIDCDYEPAGVMSVAVAPHLVETVEEEHRILASHGEDAVLLGAEETRAELDSPTYLRGVWQRSNCGICDPARLAWGLARTARALGVVVHEHSGVRALRAGGPGVEVECERASVRARRVLLATNAFPGLVRGIRRRMVPVWDYALATEPLTAEQLGRIGWRNRMGVADTTNLFHYYRLTADNRILWGGYDAVYHYGSGVDRRFEQRAGTHRVLAAHFHDTFPQLEEVRFTHRWGGPISTTTRFCVTFGTALGDRVAFVVGYTGLGVAASRFGARAGLALLDGTDTDLTRLGIVRTRPFPFPPEPFRWAGIGLTRRALARADRSHGARGPWLRLLDRFGVGFDS